MYLPIPLLHTETATNCYSGHVNAERWILRHDSRYGHKPVRLIHGARVQPWALWPGLLSLSHAWLATWPHQIWTDRAPGMQALQVALKHFNVTKLLRSCTAAWMAVISDIIGS